MNKTLSKQYIAGLFDGEGCVCIFKRNQSRGSFGLRIVMNLTTPEPLYLLQGIYGGNLRKRQISGNRKASWQWELSSSRAEVFIESIKRHSIIKLAQIKVALKMRELSQERKIKKFPFSLTDKEIETRLNLKKEMNRLNKRGIHDREFIN